MGELIPQGKGQFVRGNVAAHCKVMGHSTVRCAKTAEPIGMPFWMTTRVCLRNGQFSGGCPGHSKALSIFAATVAAASLSRSLQAGSFHRQ